MAKMKKAILFSISSLLIVSLFVILHEISARSAMQETEMEVTRTQVRVLNNVVQDMQEYYFDRIIYIASKNALIGLSTYYHHHGFASNYINSPLYDALNLTIQDCMHDPNGLPNNVDLCDNIRCNDCMEYDYTIDNLREELEELFEKIGMRMETFEVEVIEVEQPDPFHLEINATVRYHMTDVGNIASWKGTSNRLVNVSVYGVYYDEHKKVDGSWCAKSGELPIIKKLIGSSFPASHGISEVCA